MNLRTAFTLILCLGAMMGHGQFTLQGSIYDPALGQPVPGVEVKIENTTLAAVSDKDGFFRIPDLGKGVYYLNFYKEGYYPLMSDYEIKEKDREIFSIGVSMKRKKTEMVSDHVTHTQLVNRRPWHVPHSVSAYEGWRSYDEVPSHLPEALNSLTGVSATSFFHGGTGIFLRGMGGSRLPIYMDGMEMTLATSSLSENINLMTLDPLAIRRAEAIRGTGSVQYGSDALQGALLLETHRPEFSTEGWKVHGSLSGRISADLVGNAQQNPLYDGGGRAEISLHGPKLALSAGSSLYGNRDFPTANLPIDSSAYGRRFHDLDMRLALGKKHEIELSYHEGQVNHADILSQGAMDLQVEGELENLNRQSGQAKYIAYNPDTYLERVELSMGFQQFDESLSFQGPEGQWRYRDQLRMFKGKVNVVAKPIPYWHIVSGVSYTRQSLSLAEGSYESRGNGGRQVRPRVPEGSTAGDFSLYTAHTLDILKLRLSFGGRAHAYQRAFLDQEISPVVLAGNFSGMYPLHPNYKLYFSSQTGYRAPNLHDLSYQGPMVLGFAAPSDSLNPERSFSSELGLKAHTSNFNGSLALYRAQISDYQDWRPGRFEGERTYQGLPVYQSQPTGQSYVQGIEAEMEFLLNRSMVVFGNIAYTYGRNISQSQALPLIPPLNGRLGLRYQNRRGLWSRLEWRYADRQDRLGFTDLPNPRVSDMGTAGWNVIDFHIGWKHSLGYATLGIKNLLNSTYVVHGAGIPGIGRLVMVSVKLGF